MLELRNLYGGYGGKDILKGQHNLGDRCEWLRKKYAFADVLRLAETVTGTSPDRWKGHFQDEAYRACAENFLYGAGA